MAVAIIHTAFTRGIASLAMLKIARMQRDRLVRCELRTGIGIVVAHGVGLRIVGAGAVMQIAIFMAIILRLPALQGAQTPTRRLRLLKACSGRNVLPAGGHYQGKEQTKQEVCLAHEGVIACFLIRRKTLPQFFFRCLGPRIA